MNVFESPLALSSSVLLPVLAGGVILLLAAFAGACFLRRSSAAFTRGYWSAVMACLAALCVLEIALPDWFFPVQGKESVTLPGAGPGAETSLEPSHAGLVGEGVAKFESLPAAESRLPALPAERPAPRDSALEFAPVDMPEFYAHFDFRSLIETEAGMVFFVLWLAGVAFLALRLIAGRILLRRIWRKGQDLDGEWADLCREVTELVSMRRSVPVRFSPGAAVPMAWGVFRPRIALPEEARDLDVPARRALLLHELTHVRRGDAFFLLVSQVAAAFHWVNPLAWIALRRLRMAQERACDDAVLEAGSGAAEYADLLLKIAQSSQEQVFNAASVAMTMAQPSTLKKRIRAILDRKMKRKKLNRMQATVMGAVIFTITLGLAGIGFGEKKTEKAKQGSIVVDDRRNQPDGPVNTPVKEKTGTTEVKVEVRDSVIQKDESAATPKSRSGIESKPDPFHADPRVSAASGGMTQLASPTVLDFKLKETVLPLVDFQDTPLPDVLDFLAMRSIELDVFENDPDKKGINIILLREARMKSGTDRANLGDLQDRVDRQTINVQEAREEYLRQAEEIGGVDRRFLDTALEDMFAGILKARSEREAAQAELDAVMKMSLKEQGAYYGFKNEKHPISKACAALIESEKEFSDALAVMGEKHPEVVKLKKEYEAALRSVDEVVQLNLSQLQDRSAEAAKRGSRLSETYEEMRQKAARVSEDSMEGLKLKELKRRYELQLAMLENLEESLLESEVAAVNAVPRITLQVRNMPLNDVLKYVAQLAGLTLQVEDHAVLLGTPEEASALNPEARANRNENRFVGDLYRARDESRPKTAR